MLSVRLRLGLQITPFGIFTLLVVVLSVRLRLGLHITPFGIFTLLVVVLSVRLRLGLHIAPFGIFTLLVVVLSVRLRLGLHITPFGIFTLFLHFTSTITTSMVNITRTLNECEAVPSLQLSCNIYSTSWHLFMKMCSKGLKKY